MDSHRQFFRTWRLVLLDTSQNEVCSEETEKSCGIFKPQTVFKSWLRCTYHFCSNPDHRSSGIEDRPNIGNPNVSYSANIWIPFLFAAFHLFPPCFNKHEVCFFSDSPCFRFFPNNKGKGINPLPYSLSVYTFFQKLLFQLILVFVDFSSCQSVIQDIQRSKVTSIFLLPVPVSVSV